jgi:hypothetical protein
MGRDQNLVYFFISDSNNKYYTAKQTSKGDYAISKNSSPYPISFSPKNVAGTSIEFSTNQKYFSLTRGISYPFEFIKDGAFILRSIYTVGKGIEENAYVTIIQWNGSIYELLFKGRVDFNTKTDNPRTNTFKVSLVDDSAWGVLSKNDTVQYRVDCSPSNPKAVKVVVDGITLKNKLTYQPVDTELTFNVSTGTIPNAYNIIPFVLVNQDGDSYGIVVKNQTYREPHGFEQEIKDSFENFFESPYVINNLIIEGDFSFNFNKFNDFSGGFLEIYFLTTLGRKLVLYSQPAWSQNGKINVPCNFTISLAKNERLYFVCHMTNPYGSGFSITPLVSNITFALNTKADSQIVYGLRPLDLLQDLVSQATRGRYSIKSNFLSINNKSICTSGEAIRGIPNASIYSSFEDFFKTFDSLNYLALRVINGELWLEKTTDIYSQAANIFDLGEVIDCDLEPASEYMANEIQVGSPKQDLRHPSGRLEFNSTNDFSLPFLNVDKKLSIITKYRMGCFDIQFLIIDYKGSSTKDNNGDKTVYVLDITDNTISSFDDVENFVNVNINNSPLAPYIRTPYDNVVIANNKPVIKGVCAPLTNIKIYADGILDGNTTSNSSGFWSYNINTALSSYNPGVLTGVHIIAVTYTDLSSTFNSISITIDTSIAAQTSIAYPSSGDELYNNKPLVKGFGVAGANLVVILDGVNQGTVTVDNSCMFEFQCPVLSNASHTLSIGGVLINFLVNSSVAYPLITSFLNGYTEVDNLPLIEGVATPGTIVNLYLNYINYPGSILGTVVADANGNWSYQVVPLTYVDPLSGNIVVLAPIQNGLNIISTSLSVFTVKIGISGFQLNRPSYSSITGVTDNTVFNTMFSPKRMLLNRAPLLASILNKQKNELVYFQKPGANQLLTTILNGVRISESDNVPYSSLGSPLFLLEKANIKTKVPLTLNKILYNFSSGGVIKWSSRGTTMYSLPIGSMKMESITSNVQNWKLLMSPLTSYQSLLNIYKNGIFINLMKNSLYHSDYNSLHFVSYDFQQSIKYNNVELYNDWFNNRNQAWVLNPDYIQKFNNSDTFTDQIVTNGISNIELLVFDCGLAEVGSLSKGLVATIPYNSVTPLPIPGPDIVLEASVNLSSFPNSQYFFVITVGGVPVLISERIETRDSWEKTILIESNNSLDKTGFFFSTGAKSIFRIEGMIEKLQPSLDHVTSKDEVGNNESLYSLVSRKRIVRFGNAYGLPDYLYLKITDAISLDELLIEGVSYVISKDEKIEKSDDVDGHPLYYYNVLMELSVNRNGITVGAAPGYITDSVLLVVDATAFGLPSGTLINIDLG